MAGVVPRLLLSAGLLVLLGGCSGTPFGDQLARSFSTPSTPTPTPTPTPAAGPAGKAPTAATPAKPEAAAGAPAAPSAKTTPTAKAPAAAKPTAPPTTLQPAPYRVTIKLPAADPSAPAEVVTQALRAAGVSFEVEMIERVRGSGGTGTPAAPTVTPAPAPR
jgi:hypothetical protein